MTTPLQAPGDKLKKAIKEFSEQLAKKPDSDRGKLLQKVIIQFDLTPKESAFLERQCAPE